MKCLWRLAPVTILAGVLSACNGQGGALSSAADPASSVPPDSSVSDPANPPGAQAPSPTYLIDVMIFNGTGVSTSDWQSTEQIVKSQGLSYQLVNSAQLNAMSLDQIASFGVMVVPGGTGSTIYQNVTADVRLRIRQAVRERGMGYVGFCAGAWVAVGLEAETTSTASYGFAVAKGNILSLFLPGGQSPTAAMVDVSFADGSSRALVWWGGPYTPEWSGGVVARYDTGQPAISETFSGKGLVVISGPHPEAPQGWRATAGTDRDGLDYDVAIQMINAALKKQPLPAF